MTERRRQCAKCPWRKDVDPYDIPNGYSRDKHAKLTSTVQPGFAGFGGMRVMACHESDVGAEKPCVGWMVNQLGDGNNLALRLAVIQGRIDGKVETVGDQHERLEDTVPRLGFAQIEHTGRTRHGVPHGTGYRFRAGSGTLRVGGVGPMDEQEKGAENAAELGEAAPEEPRPRPGLVKTRVGWGWARLHGGRLIDVNEEPESARRRG